MLKEAPRTQNESVRTDDNHPKILLHNQNPDSPTILQSIEPQRKPAKPIENIRTFWIFSIFNLVFIPVGIICCYFSYRVRQFKIQNRYEMAKKWSKRTFVLNILTTLVMFGVIITAVMLHHDYELRNEIFQANQTRTTAVYIPWLPGR